MLICRTCPARLQVKAAIHETTDAVSPVKLPPIGCDDGRAGIRLVEYTVDVSPARRTAELLVQFVILYSLITYFVELEYGGRHSLDGHPFFVWSERIVATFFTVEYLLRWAAARSLMYPFTPMAIIDLIAILPFYLGFLIDLRSLRMIRTIRIFRLLKFYRYHEALRRIARSFGRAAPNLGAIAFLVLVFVAFSSAFILEMERATQKDKFTSLGDAAWWSVVTMTTVGYGDLYPVTWTGRLVGVGTIVFGVAVFSMFFSALQHAFAGESEGCDEETQRREEIAALQRKLDEQGAILREILERLSKQTPRRTSGAELPNRSASASE